MCTKLKEKIKMTRIKTATAITLILMATIALSLFALPLVNAHGPGLAPPGNVPWTFTSYPYIVAAPNPVGVAQTVSVVFWIDDPLPGATVTNDIRRHDYKLTITDPNGKADTQTWGVVSDSTSVQYYQFKPTQVGNYTLKFDYPAQTYIWTITTPGAATDYTNDTFTAASKTITLTVQAEPIPEPINSYPLPTEYWTRPIEGQNTYWYTVASNFLGTPYILGAAAAYGIPGAYQPDGSAPNSAHVMWTKPIQYGGVVGGSKTAVPGEMFYSGLSYNVRFANPIIMYGVLYYQEPFGNTPGSGGLFGGVGGDYVAVNLQTGKELWRVNASATGIALVPAFGYVYSFENPNQHGVLPNGLLIATQGGGFTGLPLSWRAYDAHTGILTSMNIANVPAGASIGGPSGEYLTYPLTNLGTTANPNWYLAQWNSSQVFGGGSGLSPANWYSGSMNGNVPITPAMPTTAPPFGQAWNWNGTGWQLVSAGNFFAGIPSLATSITPSYDWNVSIPSLKGIGWGVGGANLGGLLPLVSPSNMMLLVQGTFGGHPGDYGATVSTNPANVTAISLKPGTIGNVLWTKTYQPAPGNVTRLIVGWDPSNGVFVFGDKETMVFYGYSLTDGTQLWGPTKLTNDYTTDYNYMAIGLENIAYGKIYFTGYSGILYCYDDKTGDLLWTYGNGGEGNSTLSGFSTPYGRYPTFISVIADGKVYLDTTEHSPNSPLYKGAKYRCINATDGTEIWTIMDYGNQMYGGQAAVADGYLTTLNSYDSQIYSIGKGPSAMTVTAPDVSVELGKSLTIKGTVTDVSAGTNQAEQAARFPNGVPAVSDASMGEWMEYVYMQKPRPTDVTGVEVTLSVLDSNNNFQEIGTTTSDSSGLYSFQYTPDIAGKFTVYASFAGSDSFWPSRAETAFAVDPAPPAPTPPVEQPPSMTDTYIMYSTIAIVIAIVAGFAVAIVLLRKRP
jgi:outer membrane protein assembly factor BamB